MSSSAWRPSAASATSSRPARRWTVRATPRRNSGWSSAHALVAAANAAGQLDAHRALCQKLSAGAKRVFPAEGRVAGQHHVIHLFAEGMRPGGGGRAVRLRQRMGNDLGRHIGLRHHAAEQVVLAAQAEPGRVGSVGYGLARDEVERQIVMRRGIVFAGIGIAQQRRYLPAMRFCEVASWPCGLPDGRCEYTTTMRGPCRGRAMPACAVSGCPDFICCSSQAGIVAGLSACLSAWAAIRRPLTGREKILAKRNGVHIDLNQPARFACRIRVPQYAVRTGTHGGHC